jgi:hypothetical protein
MENRSVETVKRIGTGLALILAPATTLLGFAIHPDDAKTGAAQLQVIVDNYARWNLAHIAILFSAAFFIPATIGLMHLLRERGAWFGLIGGILSGFGIVFLGAQMGVDALATSAFAALPPDQRAGLVPGMQALLDLGGATPVIAFTVALTLGLFVLACGLFVARTVPRWMSVAIGIGAVLQGSLVVSPDLLLPRVSAVFLLLGLGAIGLRELRGDAAAAAQPHATGGAMAFGMERGA